MGSGVFRGARGRAPPPLRRGARPKYYKIVKKWPENASREVKKSKIFLPKILPPAPPLRKHAYFIF